MRANLFGVGGLVALLSSFAHLVESKVLPRDATIKGRALNDFDFTTGNGNCNNYMGKLGRWVPDISVLADSAIQALDHIGQVTWSQDIEFTLGNYLGIYDAAGIATARKWFSDVKSFSEGNFGAFGYSKAFLFCGDNYQEVKSGSDFARDENNNIVDLNGQQQRINQITEYVSQLNANLTPYWVRALGGYLFAASDKFRPGTPGDRCSKAFAFNSSPVKQKASITFCIYPSSAAQGQVPVDYFAADTMVQARGVAGMGELIDGEASGSTIMMHEMFHTTRGNAATDDFARTSAECAIRATGGSTNEAQASPQCAVLFAVAMDLMYAAGTDNNGFGNRVYWWGGTAMSHDNAWNAFVATAFPNPNP